MIPILYNAVTEGTVPNDYGIGALTDCLSCEVTEERNGSYELTLDYAVGGIHADEIEVNRIIKAKPNYTDSPQLFRIYKVGKAMNGRFEVNAQHISYDLSGKVLPAGILTFDALATVQAITANGGGNFTITTDISSGRTFKSDIPASTRSWFGGKTGSLLDIYGGEWKYDNFTCSLLASRGTDRGTTIRYGKNLTELSQVISLENLVTAIVPYAVNPDNNNVITGAEVPTGLSLNVDRKLAMDFTDGIEWKDTTPVITQLNTLATRYVTANRSSMINMKNSITLNFAQSGDLKERVDLCDTVRIYFEALGITASAKCVSATWDVLADRYSSNTFGDAVTNISDTIATVERKVVNVPTKNEVAQTVSEATQMITGNLGGYVVFHDSDNDGQPDEILIMDEPVIADALNVWRWNKNGLGFSSTGYAGSYDTLALTADGKINASAITAGTLLADLIKAGILSDAQGNSTINMTNGVAKMLNLKAISSFDLIESDDSIYATMGHSRPNEAHLYLLNFAKLVASSITSSLVLKNDTADGEIFLESYEGGSDFRMKYGNGTQYETTRIYQGSSGAVMNLNTLAGKLRIQNSASSTGGSIFIYNDSDNVVAQFSVGGGNKDGIMYLFKADHTATIWALGHTGNITCVSLTQTSSRKVKDNIKPIEDSAKILDLEAVSFDFKDKDKGINKRGFIAEDVEKVLPNLVTPEDEERPASINYVEMIPYLQDVIKKQEERIKVLEEKITKLGG